MIPFWSWGLRGGTGPDIYELVDDPWRHTDECQSSDLAQGSRVNLDFTDILLQTMIQRLNIFVTCVFVWGLSGHTLDKSDKRRRTALNFGNWQLLGCISTLSNTHSNRPPTLKYTYIFFGCFRIGIINQPPSYFHNQKQQISPPPILFTTNRYVHNPILKRKFRASLVPASVSCQSLRITSTVSMQVRSMTYMDICICILISFVSVCAVFVFCVAPPLPPVLAARRGRTLLGAEGSNAGKTPEIIFKKL